MNAFLKDTIIVERSTFGTDADGENLLTWSEHLTLPASVQLRDGEMIEKAGKWKVVRRGTAYTNIADVISGDRIKYLGDYYNVVYVYPISGSHQEISIVEADL